MDQPSPAPAPANRCPRCGASFTCGMTAGDARCWCMEMPVISPVPGVGSCYCPDCLKALVAERSGRT